MINLMAGIYRVMVADIEDDNYDPNDYDAIYLADGSPITQHSIRLYNKHQVLKSVLIGGYRGVMGIHATSQVCNEYTLAVCCSDTVFCFSIPNLDLLWKTIADEFTCFEIFRYEEDYIVHGEVEISRLNSSGEIIWQKSGADIFTTLKGRDDFIITPNYIEATDFDGRKYYFDFDGNTLNIK